MNRQNKYILTIYLLANIALAFFLKENASYLSILMMCVNLSLGIIWTFSCFGLKRSLMLIVISFAVTISLENISINTGYPYGELKHALPGPMIGSVPLIIGLSYFPLITISWLFGDIIVNALPMKKAAMVHLRILIAVLVASILDILSDPVFTLVFKLWGYPQGGGIFGVPMSNTLGWVINSFLTLSIFEILGRGWERRQKAIDKLHSAVCYLLLAQLIPIYICRFTLGNRIVPDITGKGWNLLDMYDCLLVFGTLIIGILYVFGTICRETIEKRSSKTSSLSLSR